MRTKSKLIFAVTFLPILMGIAPGLIGQVTSWKQIKIKPLPAFHPQEPKRIELSNGMVIFLQEDHELPLIRGTARIRGGSRDEPADKAGLVSIYADTWRTGGTKAQTGDQLDDFLEARAARVEAGGSLDSTTLSWDCLKERLDEVFPVFVDLLRDPEFREDKLPVAKNQVNTSISRRNDDPGGIAAREARLIGYGANSPYAREPEYATVAAVTRQDLMAWHHAHVYPNNIILGVEGDFDSTAMEAKLRSVFESWQKGPEAEPAKLSFEDPKPGVYFAEKDDVNQTNIRMVELGTRRDNPDYYAISVVNEIFGGSFSSRLVQSIRTDKGLAYEVGGGIGTAFDHPGLFQVVMGTKSGTTAAAIDALYQEIDGLRTKPPTADELKKAKDSILNSFVFQFDSKEKVLAERMGYEFYGYPADYLERFQAGIERVTLADAARVAAQYVHKDKLAVIVVGKASDFDRPLSSFGTVTALDITIPSGAPEAPKATASNAAGRALMAKVIEGLGGAEKLRQVKALREKVKLTVVTPQGEMALDGVGYSVFPDRLAERMMTPGGEVALVVSPEASFMSTPMGTRDLPGEQKERMLTELRTDPIYVAQHADDSAFVFAAGGNENVGGAEATILDVNAGGPQVRWFVDAKTGKVLRSSSHSAGAMPGEEISDYSDWKLVDGISFPFKETTSRGGTRASTEEVQEIEINPKIDPKTFVKPAAPAGADQK